MQADTLDSIGVVLVRLWGLLLFFSTQYRENFKHERVVIIVSSIRSRKNMVPPCNNFFTQLCGDVSPVQDYYINYEIMNIKDTQYYMLLWRCGFAVIILCCVNVRFYSTLLL